MIKNQIKIRVRYGETDQMGYVYYGNYAQYFEVGRVEWLRSLGFSYKSLEESGVMLPVTHLEIEYLRPGKYDDLLTVTTTLSKKPMVRIEFDFEIVNELGVISISRFHAKSHKSLSINDLQMGYNLVSIRNGRKRPFLSTKEDKNVNKSILRQLL